MEFMNMEIFSKIYIYIYTYSVYYENSNIVDLTIYLLHNTVYNSKKLLHIIIIQFYLY